MGLTFCVRSPYTTHTGDGPRRETDTMKNSPAAIAKSEAIDATKRIRTAQNASLYEEAAAALAYRDIIDGVTPVEDYPSVTARFTEMADALGAPVIR